MKALLQILWYNKITYLKGSSTKIKNNILMKINKMILSKQTMMTFRHIDDLSQIQA
jgi:hypothetical protein